MSGHKPFKNLSDQLRATPEGRAAVARQGTILRDMLALHKLREARGVTQVQLAKAWDTSQTNVSRVEHEQDVYLSTLRAYIEALGGQLELRAVFPDQTITLGGPSDSPPAVTTPAGNRLPKRRRPMDRVQRVHQGGIVDIQPLLNELCVDLGFCLPPAEQAHLRQAPPADIDQFTDAVFVAEGLPPDEHKDLRLRVRERVQRYFLKER